MARSDVTVVCRTKIKMDVALDTRAGRVLIWTYNDDDDEVHIGETNDHDFLESLENMVLRASKGLSEMQGKALCDLVLNSGTSGE